MDTILNDLVNVVERIKVIERIKTFNNKEEYVVNETTKDLFDIVDGKITLPRLNKKIFDYVKNNNLFEKNRIMRVNADLAKALNLSQRQIDQINNATHIMDNGCMSFYNLASFTINCFDK